MNVRLVPAIVFGYVFCTNAVAEDVKKAEPVLTERVVAHDKDFLVCARLSNLSAKSLIVTAPFSFKDDRQVGVIIEDLQGRNTKNTSFISSLPSPPNAGDRLSYTVLKPGDGLETCASFAYDKFDVPAVKVRVYFNSWYQGWEQLPFSSFERSLMYEMPAANQSFETSCIVDLKKKTSECPNYFD